MSSSKTTNKPNDLGIKIGTPKQQLLEEMQENLERQICINEIATETDAVILNVVKRLISKEKEKFK